MSGRVVVHTFGGPEVLKWEEGPAPKPGAGEVLVRHTAIGLNFIDVYHRNGLYKAQAALPFTPGVEAAGVIEAVGPAVEGLRQGERVGYFSPSRPGAYADERVVPADRLIKLPAALDDQTAAAVLLKGSTAEYLVRRAYPVKKGDWVLLHAAAGGVGLLAAQWLKALGARVIGTAGSEEKAELAAAHGCAHVILYAREDVPARVRAITGGRGVDVVYDSVGKATLEVSLASLKPRGVLVSFGNASGAVPAVAPLELAAKGSLYLTRPTLKDYYATPEDFREGTSALLKALAAGTIRVRIGQRYPLREAAQAHRDLEGRKTTGSTVLVPENA
jgi:NADPH:quinone reductase